VKELPKIKPREAIVGQPLATEARLILVERRGTAAESSAESPNAVVRGAKRFWAAARRLNKRAGEAEARLILRVFYFTVFGVLRLVRRDPIEIADSGEVAWSPRESSGTDPTKQY
jgi:hypothetical protein